VIPTIKFKPQKEDRLLGGSLWAYRQELDLEQKDHAPGSLVRLATAKGRPLAVGFINTRSSIAVRVLARSGEFDQEEDAAALLRWRLGKALERRSELLPGVGDLRLVFSEGDCLPGLVVDRFGTVLIVQITSAGMEEHRQVILDFLKGQTGCRAIVERSEGFTREKEGLAPASGLLWKDENFDPSALSVWTVHEGRLTFQADLLSGQKTGFYLDQRDTRSTLGDMRLSHGRACLDAFCHTGSFSVALAKSGAASVLGLEASAEALRLAQRNAQLNGVQSLCSFEAGDAFQRLRTLEKEGRRFGLVLLDPPSFTKSKDGLENALRGYKEINYRALKLLEPGGYLISCSCTQAVEEPRFLSILQSAGRDAGSFLRVLRVLGQPLDHPSLLGMPETKYLKVVIAQKA
jgi:23S rRNA (cytosine1962-C5)-methyltransferase